MEFRESSDNCFDPANVYCLYGLASILVHLFLSTEESFAFNLISVELLLQDFETTGWVMEMTLRLSAIEKYD